MPGSHNVDELFDDIEEIVDSFNFETTVEGKTIALESAGLIADGIIARSIDDQRGATSSWPALNPKYKARKVKEKGVELIGVRTGQMLSLKAVIGSLQVTTDEVQMLYGTAEADPDDPDITDIEKAFFFSQRRPFYELDDAISDRVFSRIEELFSTYLVQAW